MYTGDPAFMRRLLVLAVPLVLLPVQEARAQTQVCLIAPAKLSQDVMDAFKERPRALLERFPMGGPALSVEVMRRTGTELAVLPTIIQLARDGSDAQKVAIGMGLARICILCSHTHPDVEQEIKKAVTAAGIPELTVAFTAGLTSLRFAAVPLSVAAEIDIRPISGDLPAGGGGGQPPVAAGGGPRTDGEGAPLTFSNRGIMSTYRDSVSPTRR